MIFTLQRIEAALRSRWWASIGAMLLSLMATSAFAHGVAEDDKLFIEQASGMQLMPFIYLGAKHMVTGYDHLLFLFGVIFSCIACVKSESTSRCSPSAIA